MFKVMYHFTNGNQMYCLPKCALNSHLRPPITLDFCFRDHPVVNAFKNSFEEETQGCQILRKIKASFSGVVPSQIHFYHCSIARLIPSGIEIALKTIFKMLKLFIFKVNVNAGSSYVE